MNGHNDQGGLPQESARDASLRLALRGLPREIEPARDLWPDIALRLHANAAPLDGARRGRRSWVWPVAMAASLLVAAGLTWNTQADLRTVPVAPVAPVGSSIVQREAASLTVQYQAAMQELNVQSTPASWQAGLVALDQSAAEIRQALQDHPESRLLLERLRATYTRRIAISRRALHA